MLITGHQLAAARALIGIDQASLASLAKVSAQTIAALEASNAAPIGGDRASLAAVQAALEAKGVEFLNDGRPGVRLAGGGSASVSVENLTSENDE